jgi:antitoxin (DNA-binding transcriptional repressor) of toxin-antitoxin stability system
LQIFIGLAREWGVALVYHRHWVADIVKRYHVRTMGQAASNPSMRRDRREARQPSGQSLVGRFARGGRRIIRTMDIRELAERLEEVLAITATGGEVILTDGEARRGRLVPCAAAGHRIAGALADAIQAAPDFDAALPDEFWFGHQ